MSIIIMEIMINNLCSKLLHNNTLVLVKCSVCHKMIILLHPKDFNWNGERFHNMLDQLVYRHFIQVWPKLWKYSIILEQGSGTSGSFDVNMWLSDE